MTSMSIGGLNGMEGGAIVNFGAEPVAPHSLPRSSSPMAHALRPFGNVEAAIAAIEALDRDLRKFEIAVADNLQDYLGLQMALITDSALARGWEPISFMQKDGFRLYRYKAMR